MYSWGGIYTVIGIFMCVCVCVQPVCVNNIKMLFLCIDKCIIHHTNLLRGYQQISHENLHYCLAASLLDEDLPATAQFSMNSSYIPHITIKQHATSPSFLLRVSSGHI